MPGHTSPHLSEPNPEVSGHLGVQDGIETGVGVGQHVGHDLNINRLKLSRHILINLFIIFLIFSFFYPPISSNKNTVNLYLEDQLLVVNIPIRGDQSLVY